jgi:hypothetical protein
MERRIRDGSHTAQKNNSTPDSVKKKKMDTKFLTQIKP